MTEFFEFRKPITATHCASNGECVICDDGAVFFGIPDGDKPRQWVEGSAIPGTARAHQREQRDVEAHVFEWEQVARNLAQVLVNAAAWIEKDNGPLLAFVDPAKLRSAFKDQCAAHGIAL